jgi:ABC-type uncharacterized transport system ATPase subunit
MGNNVIQFTRTIKKTTKEKTKCLQRERQMLKMLGVVDELEFLICLSGLSPEEFLKEAESLTEKMSNAVKEYKDNI